MTTHDELLARADSRRNDTECRTQDRLLIADLAAALRAAGGGETTPTGEHHG